MTIEEAVRHCYEVAENNCADCGKEHLQLAEWLRELEQLRFENSALRLAIASVPEMDWIPCSERFPDHGEEVLICTTGGSMTTAEYDNGDWCLISGGCLANSSVVTHWMPLPEPPEDKENENRNDNERY